MRPVLPSLEAEFRRYHDLGGKALAQLDAEGLVRRAPGEGNSVAILVWHVAGNLRSRFTDFLTTDGEKPWRDRESEFVRREVQPAEALARWEEGWAVLFTTLAALGEADLERTVRIRSQEMTVLDALHRALGHTSYHVGQIVLLARSHRGEGWKWLSVPPGQSDAFNRKLAGDQGPKGG